MKNIILFLLLTVLSNQVVFALEKTWDESSKQKEKCPEWLNEGRFRNGSNVLWYKEPASHWLEAMPLGNGRLGAMPFGGVRSERILLNEGSLWAGKQFEVYPDNFKKNLAKQQKMILEGNLMEAEKFGFKHLTKKPTSFRSYERLGYLHIDMKHSKNATDYHRGLDIEKGIAWTSYKIGDVKYTREVLVSAVDDILVIKISADKPKALSGQVNMVRWKDATFTAKGKNRLHMNGQIVDVEAADGGPEDNPSGGSGPGGANMKFAGRLFLKNKDGELTAQNESLQFENASEIVILFTAATDYNLEKLNYDRSIDPAKLANDILEKAQERSWSAIRERHVNEHAALFNRVSINLGDDDKGLLPTDERLEKIREGDRDNAMHALRFQYGRYLLMSCSRKPGRLPAGLQGIWNGYDWAPWENDYHLNINFQMNYWGANVGNLRETLDPFVDWFGYLTKRGQNSASKMYGAEGWVAFTATNPFGRVTPSASYLTSQYSTGVLDPLAGAWMSMTLWRDFEYTRDKEYLKNVVLPVLKGACEFIRDYLTEDKNGNLIIVPSCSPENVFFAPDNETKLRTCTASTYHMTIVRVVLNAYIEGAGLLEIDKAFCDKLGVILERLPPLYKINKSGGIFEWDKDYEEVEIHHRHISHLIGVYPFSLLTKNSAPELTAAAKKTLDRRVVIDKPGNGWDRIHFASAYTRLGYGEKALALLDGLLKWRSYNSLLGQSSSAWRGIDNGMKDFQMDSNVGVTSCMAEMLVQSHEGYIDLLPALPDTWSQGKVKGICVRGGVSIDISWEESQLVTAVLTSSLNQICRVKYKSKVVEVKLKKGEPYVLYEFK